VPKQLKPTTNPTKPLDELIAEARAALTAQHETAQKQHVNKSRAATDAAWEESERQRKLVWCTEHFRDNFYPLSDPYRNFSDEDYVRIYLPWEGRAEALCRAGMVGEGLRVWLYRLGGKASVADVQAWLEPLVPWEVYGKALIGKHPTREDDRMIIHAHGLSDEMKDLLLHTSMVHVRDGIVGWLSNPKDKHYVPEEW